MRGSEVSTLFLSVSWETRHASSCVELTVENESKSESTALLLGAGSLVADPMVAVGFVFVLLVLLVDEGELSSSARMLKQLLN